MKSVETPQHDPAVSPRVMVSHLGRFRLPQTGRRSTGFRFFLDFNGEAAGCVDFRLREVPSKREETVQNHSYLDLSYPQEFGAADPEPLILEENPRIIGTPGLILKKNGGSDIDGLCCVIGHGVMRLVVICSGADGGLRSNEASTER